MSPEALLSIWSRRAISVPLYLVLAGVALVAAPLWLPVSLLVDAATGKARLLPRTRALAFFALYLGCEVVGIATATALWLVTLGGRLGGPELYRERNAALQRWWTGTLFFASLRLFSMRLSTEGLELARQGPMLLFVRHASMADTVLAAALVANPGRLLLRYVVKRELLWDPCIDLVGRRLPNAFVDRRGADLSTEVDAVAGLARGLDARSAVLIYPEGTRFSEAKRLAALPSLGRSDLADLAEGFRSVLPPRLRGPLALLAAAPGVDVVLLEHTGFEGASSFSKLWKGTLVGGTLRVRLRRIPAASIPAEGRDRWLFESWAEMDRWIQEARGMST